MQYTLTASKPRPVVGRVREVTDSGHTESVRFTDDGLGWTHRYGGSSDGILVELLDSEGNVQGNATLREADILALAKSLQP
jgi:hypothetical protein